MKCLIVGCGRAGKRHKKLAEAAGLEVVGVDPIIACDWNHYVTMWEALDSESFDYIVLATPPDIHLHELSMALDTGIPTLCEKPLCGFGQLKGTQSLRQDAPVMIAYNYAFHPKLMNRPSWTGDPSSGWALISYQNRPPLPKWGHLLDHVPHSFFILRRLIGALRIASVMLAETPQGTEFRITGSTENDMPFLIYDAVRTYQVEKYAGIHSPHGQLFLHLPEDLDQMFVTMWEHFLAKDYNPGIAEAVEVQKLVEQAELMRLGGPAQPERRKV